tara:strand:+ start:1974 stop:2267 length:294 start_codon:yes stop_codon:yes gene_type:complete
MSTKIIKCECGGSYREGTTRHLTTPKHMKYLKDEADYKSKYVDVMVLIMTEKFSGDDRMERSKDYLDKRLLDAPDKNKRIKDIKTEFMKKAHMTTQA